VIIVIIVVAVVLVLGIGFFVARRRGRARVAIPAPARAAMPTVLVTELAERPSLEAPSLASASVHHAASLTGFARSRAWGH